MKNNILIFGKGFIGQRLADALSCEACDTMIHSVKDALLQIDRFKPAIIINCIGFTGASNVDDCEKDVDATLSANTFVPVVLAEAAIRRNIKLVHISSGCIYHYDYANQPPITETDRPDFYDLFYSRSKIYSESALLSLVPKFDLLIARIRIPLDNRVHPKNILHKLITYKKIIDIPNSVTYIPDFLSAMRHLIAINAHGLYNVVNSKGLRYARLMDIYKKYVPDFSYQMIDFRSLNLIRSNLILSTKKLEDSGFKVRAIDEVLEECVQGYLGRTQSDSRS